MKQTNPRPSYRLWPIFPCNDGCDDEVGRYAKPLRQISHAQGCIGGDADWTFTVTGSERGTGRGGGRRGKMYLSRRVDQHVLHERR